MDPTVQREINSRLRALESRAVLVKGEITAASPLSVALAGSAVPITTARALSTAAVPVGAQVWCLKWPGDLLILGGVSSATGVSAFIATLLDDANAAAARATLGLNAWGTWFDVAKAAAPGSVAATANLLYFAQVKVLNDCTLTGIAYLVGTTQSGNVKAGIFDSAGTRVASTTGTVAQTAAVTYQKVPFASTLAATAGIYYIALVFSSGTGTYFGSVANCPAGSSGQGSHTVGTPLTVPTTSAVVNVPNMTTY